MATVQAVTLLVCAAREGFTVWLLTQGNRYRYEKATSIEEVSALPARSCERPSNGNRARAACLRGMCLEPERAGWRLRPEGSGFWRLCRINNLLLTHPTEGWQTARGPAMDYRCEATTIEGFVQQLAVSYVANGYWFYVCGVIPERKDPRAIDRKLISRYGIGISKWARARRKVAGLANLHYLRHGRFFVLIATRGKHPFFEEERSSLKDVRETPIKFASYAIGFRGGHPHVRIERETARELKAFFVDKALRSSEWLEREFRKLPFEPYAPVRRQLLSILGGVNRRRREAGIEEVPLACLRLRRRPVRPFATELKAEEPADAVRQSRQV